MAGQIEQRPLTTPNPDPTAATTAALLREISGSKELGEILVRFTREVIDERITGARQVLETRLDSMAAALARVPTHSQENVNQLRDIVDEKFKVQDERFNSVQTQFKERDVRTDQKEKDNKVGIDAALAASQKSVDKTEMNFKEQIQATGLRIDTVSKGADEKHSDLKDRVIALEARMAGMAAQRAETALSTTQQTSNMGNVWGIVFGAAGLIFAAISIAVVFAKP